MSRVLSWRHCECKCRNDVGADVMTKSAACGCSNSNSWWLGSFRRNSNVGATCIRGSDHHSHHYCDHSTVKGIKTCTRVRATVKKCSQKHLVLRRLHWQQSRTRACVHNKISHRSHRSPCPEANRCCPGCDARCRSLCRHGQDRSRSRRGRVACKHEPPSLRICDRSCETPPFGR